MRRCGGTGMPVLCWTCPAGRGPRCCGHCWETPHPAYAATTTGRGVLLRLLIGENLELLLRDDDLVLALSLTAPNRRHGGGRSVGGGAS